MPLSDVLASFGIFLAISLVTGLLLGGVVYGLLREVIQRMRARRPLLHGAPLDLLVGMGEWVLRHAVLLVGGSIALAITGLVLAGITEASGWLLLSAPFMGLLVVFGIASAEYFAFQQAHLSSVEEKEWNRLYRWA